LSNPLVAQGTVIQASVQALRRERPGDAARDERVARAPDPVLMPGRPGAHPPWLSESMRAVLDTLCDLVERQSGVFLVTGAAGVGKSVFAAQLAAELEAAGHLVLACDRSGLPLDHHIDSFAASLRRGDRLASGAAMVLLRDDAELLTRQTLRRLVALLGVTQRAEDGVRVILVGRPALRRLIAGSGLAGLRRLVRYHGRLEPLGEANILDFLSHPMAPGGVTQPIPAEVLTAILEHTAGSPAQVAFLWTRACQLARDDRAALPEPGHIEQAARTQPSWLRDDTPAPALFEPAHSLPAPATIRRAAAAVAAAAVVALWLALPPFSAGPAGRTVIAPITPAPRVAALPDAPPDAGTPPPTVTQPTAAPGRDDQPAPIGHGAESTVADSTAAAGQSEPTATPPVAGVPDTALANAAPPTAPVVEPAPDPTPTAPMQSARELPPDDRAAEPMASPTADDGSPATVVEQPTSTARSAESLDGAPDAGTAPRPDQPATPTLAEATPPDPSPAPAPTETVRETSPAPPPPEPAADRVAPPSTPATAAADPPPAPSAEPPRAAAGARRADVARAPDNARVSPRADEPKPRRGESAPRRTADIAPPKPPAHSPDRTPPRPRPEPSDHRMAGQPPLEPRSAQREAPPATAPPMALVTPPPPETRASPPPAPSDTQIAGTLATPVSAQPQCQPYVSQVDFAGRTAQVRGLACRDPTGKWWLMNQRTE
jgi:type II secretory pathway predicted ATPase ExeA